MKRSIVIMVLPLLALLTAGMAGCSPKTVKIGFVGSLMGRLSDTSIAGRNGVLLAVDEINRNGGVYGRSIELLIKDDKLDMNDAVAVDRELIEAEVLAIIGHMTSEMSVAVIPLINQKKMLMISPAASTSKLAGLDDYFFCVQPSNADIAARQGLNIYQKLKIHKLTAVFDLSNQAFSEDWYQSFKSKYESLGGRIVLTKTFKADSNMSFLNLAQEITTPKTEGILLISSAIDTAMLAQQIRKMGSHAVLLSTGWAFSGDLLQYGGPTVEGLFISHVIDPDNTTLKYRQFQKAYKDKFGTSPNAAAVLGYEAMQVLFTGMTKSRRLSPENLKMVILKEKMFHGLQADFMIDNFGDANRTEQIFIIQKGKFKRVDKE